MTPRQPNGRQEPHWPVIDQRAISSTFEQPVGGGAPDHHWVYLWHWPIRAMHWIAAVCLVTLTVTGLWIGRPYFIAAGPGTNFGLQWVRLIHFSAAALLVATAIVRIYWLWAGNRFERLPALFPVRKSDWVNMWKMVKFYLMIHPERAPRYLGHNPMQQLAYTFTYVMAAVMVVTGFVMFGEANPTGIFMHTFGHLAPLMGGFQMVRVIHHVCTWYFPAFIIVHVYLAVRSDMLERSGTMSSMVSGGRFVPIDEHYADG